MKMPNVLLQKLWKNVRCSKEWEVEKTTKLIQKANLTMKQWILVFCFYKC
jgi:hypothetical protein